MESSRLLGLQPPHQRTSQKYPHRNIQPAAPKTEQSSSRTSRWQLPFAAQIACTSLKETNIEYLLTLSHLIIRAVCDIAHLKTCRWCVGEAVWIRLVAPPTAVVNGRLRGCRVVECPPCTCVIGAMLVRFVGHATVRCVVPIVAAHD